MLEVHSDLISAAQVEQKGEGVDVCSSAQKHSQLQRNAVKDMTQKVMRSRTETLVGTTPV